MPYSSHFPYYTQRTIVVDQDMIEYAQRQTEITEYIDVVLESCIGDFNDHITRQVVHTLIHDYIESLQTFRGIDFVVICDETNNSPKLVDKGVLVVDVTGYNICRVLYAKSMYPGGY
jgi:predicted component of type VI protein secretion system